MFNFFLCHCLAQELYDQTYWLALDSHDDQDDHNDQDGQVGQDDQDGKDEQDGDDTSGHSEVSKNILIAFF